MRKRTTLTLIIGAVTAFVAAAVFCGVFFGRMMISPEIFIEQADGSGVFENTTSTRIPQTAIYNVMRSHMEAANEKTPMLLFIGYDGCLANAVARQKDKEGSAIMRLKSEGGLYLGFAGGAAPGDQDTSTAPGWTSMWTGVWANRHGVTKNGLTLSSSYETIIYRFAKEGFPDSFSTLWAPHFKDTYKDEIASAKANNYPADYNLVKNNKALFNAMNSKIASSAERAIFGIFEECDHAGHSTGFTVRNPAYTKGLDEAESYAMRLIDSVEARPTYDSEDWLIIITTDHGGNYLSHGGETVMESTTFFAINKKIEPFD
jgi:Uncharacterized proteins of the AP superfamily